MIKNMPDVEGTDKKSLTGKSILSGVTRLQKICPSVTRKTKKTALRGEDQLQGLEQKEEKQVLILRRGRWGKIKEKVKVFRGKKEKV